MKRILIVFAALLAVAGSAMAQKVMSPPHVMVVPDLIYCKAHGFTKQFQDEGVTTTIPDYERALTEDPTLHGVLTQVAQLLTDRNDGFVIVDIVEAINNARADRQMGNFNDADPSESAEEAVLRASQADIIIKVQYDLLKTGPQYQVQYTIRGTDAYTNQMFAPIEGVSPGSTAANPVLLLRGIAGDRMNAFIDKVWSYYNNMTKNGRMVAFDIRTTSTSGVNMNSKVGQYALREVIEDLLYDNSIEGNGLERVKGGNTFLKYEGVYIPLVSTIRGRQRKQGAKDVAAKVIAGLEQHGINAECKIRGLGKVYIYIK